MNYKTVLRFVALVFVFTLLGAALAQDDMVTIVYWDEPQSPGAEVVINQIIENFEAANPGVDVVREVIGWEVLRDIADGLISPEEGVKIYHNTLKKLGIAPLRNFEDDMVLFTPGLV